MKFKIDDRVKLTSGQWVDKAGNPLWNGRFGCVGGTITRAEDVKRFCYSVRWDNGCHNGYYKNDLELIETEIDIMFDDVINNL